MSSDDRSRKEFIDEETLLSPGDFYLMHFSEKWLSNYGTNIQMANLNGCSWNPLQALPIPAFSVM